MLSYTYTNHHFVTKGEIKMSMNEDVFFNPGQSIASDYDYNKAYIAAQVYHQKVEKPVLLVKRKGDQSYLVFDEEAAVAEEKRETKNVKSYKVVKRIK